MTLTTLDRQQARFRVLDLQRRVLEREPLAAASARAAGARRGSRPRARRARARRAPGSRWSPSRRAGRAPGRRPCSATSARPTASGSIAVGERSRKIDADSRSRPQLAHSISAATPRLAIGSKRSQPVTRISAPAIAVPAKATHVRRDVQEGAADVQALARRAREHRGRGQRSRRSRRARRRARSPPRTSSGEISRRTAP